MEKFAERMEGDTMMSFFENLSTLDDALTRNAFLGEEKARRRPREAARGEAKVEHSDDDDDGDAISLSFSLHQLPLEEQRELDSIARRAKEKAVVDSP